MSESVAMDVDENTGDSILKTLGPCKYTEQQKASVKRRLEEKSLQGKPQTDVDGPCRLWKCFKDRDGYGQISVAKKNRFTHRVCFEVTHNVELPSDIMVRHLCANRSCTNPDHLAIGTAQDNANDKVKAGRAVTGEKHHAAKISKETALGIAEEIKNGMRVSEISKKFNCSWALVNSVKTGASWSSVTGIPKKSISARKKLELCEKDEEEAKKHIEDRIQKVMEGDHEHWIWQNAIWSGGYGHATFHNKPYQAHILSWRSFNKCKPIPKGMHVRHSCRLRHCVNPHTLCIGTAKENALDKERDGTVLRGMKNPTAKLTDEQVEEIRNLRSKGALQAAIARNFGITQAMVSLIVLGKARKRA